MISILSKYLFHSTVVLFLVICGMCGCGADVASFQELNRQPDIFPDYRDVTIPVNIAPLNFSFRDSCQKIKIHFVQHNQILLKCKGKRRISIPAKKWSEMLYQTAGSDLQVCVFAKRANKWYAYRPFNIHVASDSIDPYIAYRLIDPGYELWDKMGIYQRNLSNFDESAIILNRLTGKNCMNCHSFHNYNPDRMMFHSRGKKFSGTFLYADGRMQRVNTKTEHAPSAGTYPMWHPSGDYIAFSSNTTRQAFHALPDKKITVYDLDSDLVIWNIKNNAMLRDARFTTAELWETYPEWSPDGKWLYYCCADRKKMPFESKNLKYGLYRVDFDAATGSFGNHIDTLLNPEMYGKSVSFPRISPDGRYILYTASAYATFPIWHSEADLEMIDLSAGQTVDTQVLNSNEADSYHAWSSNGRWIVFSSRRIDGLHTRLYFAYFDTSGRIHQPFLLPQKNPDFYRGFLKSYNVPEFVKGKVDLNPYEISRTLDGEMTDLKEIIVNK